MAPRDPTLSGLLRTAIDARLLDVRVAIPATIETYDPASQTCSAQPAVKTLLADGSAARLPVVVDIPVVFPRGGGAFLSIPLKKGDRVLLLFADAALDRWLTRGEELEPLDARGHDLTDAVAIPGLYPMSDPIDFAATFPSQFADRAVLGREDGAASVQVGDDGKVYLGDGLGAFSVALAEAVLARIAALEAAFSAHTHTYTTPAVPAGPGPTSTPPPFVPPPTPLGSVSVKVKA